MYDPFNTDGPRLGLTFYTDPDRGVGDDGDGVLSLLGAPFGSALHGQQLPGFDLAGFDDLAGWSQGSGEFWVARSTGSGFVSGSWDAGPAGVAWADVQGGDFNGDGKADLFARDPATNELVVWVSDGNGFDRQVWGQWPAGTWLDVVVGDFDGDGLSDVAGRFAGDGNVFVARSTGSSFTSSSWDTWYTGAPWRDVRVGDFNGDGKDDLAAGVVLTGPVDTDGDGTPDTPLTFRDVFVAESTGSSFVQKYWHSWDGRVTWADVRVGDFDGDGKADLAARVAENGAVFVSADYHPRSVRGFGGQQFWQLWSTAPSWDVGVGDFDGDGKSDLAARVRQNGAVFFSEGFDRAADYAANPSPQTFVQQWQAGDWTDMVVGDFDGDGLSDLAARLLGTGGWYVSGSRKGSGFDQALWGGVWDPRLTWLDVRAADYTGA